MSARIGRGAGVLAVVVLALGLVGCGEEADEGGGATSTTSTTTTNAESPSTSSTTEPSQPETEGVPVAVYFVRDEKVAAGRAEVEPPSTARGALEALLGGPGGADGAEAMTSEVPAGTRLLDVAIDGGTAVVDLSGEFTSGGGSLSMQLRAAQVAFTLLQFDTVDAVTFLVDGRAVDGLGGEGVAANEVDRSDFGSVTPLVLVTSPLPGQRVVSPLTVEGISNTFESTVLYEVVDAEGATLADGFTTATAGSGTWGEFQIEVSLDGAAPGPVTLVAFQEDMEDGGRQDVYEVPLQLG